MKRILYIIIGAAMLLVACSDGRTAQMLSQIDTLMNDHPDSALAKLDSLKPEKASWPKSLRMRFDLLEAKAQNKAFVDFTTDSIAKEFTRYYDSHGTPNERMLAHYLLGCVYRDLGEAPVAVDCYLDAISQADTTARDCDFYILSCAYAQMADVFYQQLLLSSNIDALRKASIYAFHANKPSYAILNLEKVAGAFILQNKKDSAEILIQDVRSQYLKHDLIQKSLQASLKLIYLFVWDKNRLYDAKKLMDEYELSSNLFDDNHELPASKRIFYYYKGKYFEGVNNLDSAEYYYRKVYYPNMPFTSQNSMYKGLLSVYTKRYQADSIVKYAQLYCNVNDSSIAKKDQELTAQMAASYNYNRFQKEALQNETRANRTRIVLLIVLSFAFISGIVAWNIYLRKKKQKEYELENLRKEYANATDEYNKNLHTLEILDYTHKKIIETIQEELNKSVHENESYREKLREINTEYEENKAELTNENQKLVEAIQKLEQREGISHYMENTEKLMETFTVKRLKNLEMIPLSRLSEKDWDSLIIEFMTYIPNLLSDLNSIPKITKQKTRACLLVALKIQDGCIANWLNLKPTRVSNIKAELNKELFDDASARSLYNNLRQKYNIISSGKY